MNPGIVILAAGATGVAFLAAVFVAFLAVCWAVGAVLGMVAQGLGLL